MFILVFASCGGGGSSNSDTPATPLVVTPPVNNAPVAVVVSTQSASSSSEIVLDGSTSTYDSAIVSFFWPQTEGGAFTSIYTLMAAIKSQSSESESELNTLAESFNIVLNDDFGTGETNDGGDSRNLPIYKQLVVNGASIEICSFSANGTFNKLGNNNYGIGASWFRQDSTAAGSGFIYLELTDYTGDGEPEPTADNRQLIMSMGLILAVSWDALWSAPAKSTQVIGWPELFVWGSFIFVGVVVAFCAVCGLAMSNYFCLSKLSASIQSKWHYVGILIQYSVISYFGVLTILRYTLQFNVHWLQVLTFCLVLVLLTFEALQVRQKLKLV